MDFQTDFSTNEFNEYNVNGVMDNGFNPALNSISTGNLEFSSFNSPMGDMALNFGANFVGNEVNRVNSMIENYAGFLRYYFDVNTSYVVRKLTFLLFPYTKKKLDWKRSTDYNGYLSPREDVNAPDLYIPLMSFVTFVIITAFLMGTVKEFTPEVLGSTATTSIICIILEAALMKFGYYLMGAYESLSVIDFLSYSGYAFVPVIFNTIIGVSFGSTAYYVSWIITSTSMCVFLFRNLVHSLLPSATINQSDPRILLLIAIAVVQYFIILFLGHQAKWDSNVSILQLLFNFGSSSVSDDLPFENIVQDNIVDNTY